MTLMHTESFMGFGRMTVDDAFTPENTAIRKAVADNLRAGGYEVVIGSYGSTSGANGFIVRPDPVAPERAALTFSPSPNTTAGTTLNAAVRKVLPAQARAVIGGFSLYIPQEFVPATTGDVALLLVNASPADAADSLWSGAGGSAGTNTALQIFNIGRDMSVRMGSLVQSARRLTPGRLHFLEFRIADSDVRVWLDDVLVLQHSSPLVAEAISFSFATTSVAAQQFMYGAAGRWAISNFYVLAEDERAPNVRLGPTTRVIGVRPSSDVDVDFQRPAGFTSNAEIAAQNIVAQPGLTLQTTSVGDQDVYAAANDISTPNAKLVHAVATKVMASNLEAVLHRARALIRSASGVEQVDRKAREIKIVPGQIAAGTRDFMHCALRPSDNAIFMCGSAESLYKTPPNGVPGSPWSMVVDGGSSTVIYNAIAFRSDGTGVIGRSDGKIQIIPAGSDTPGPIISPGSGSNIAAIAGVLVTPDGAFTMTASAAGRVWRCAGDPSVPANWTLISISGITTSMVFQRPAYAPGSNKLALITTTGLIRISSDMGKTYVDPGLAARSNVSAVRDQFASDGTRLLFVGAFPSSSAGATAYSADGVTWVDASRLYNAANGTQTAFATTLVFGADGVFFVSLGSNFFMTTDPSQAFRRFATPLTPDGIQPTLRGACVAYNGDWIFACVAGIQLAYTTQEFDTNLPPLAGFKMAYNMSTVNPDTGNAWTPAEATQAQFGVRITS